MSDKAKVWAMMAIGAVIGAISGAETAGKIPGKIENLKQLAQKGKIDEPAEEDKQE